ncbi:MAG TPA: hypothetical protein VF909_01675 [Roseiflexaceae bacterium]
MRFAHLAACAATIVAAGLATPSHAQPLLTSGIGLQSCEKLGPELKPADGLNHPPNYLLYYWVQGYISAANIFLLNEYTDYVDMAKVDPATILKLIAEFCKENPDKQPISAIDKFIRDADKVEARESDAFDPWEH